MATETVGGNGSSMIAAVSYDDDSQSMEVDFQSGDSWTYLNVPQSVFAGFSSASSMGQYYHRHVKGRYAGQRSG